MKKILLGTTALFGAALISQAALADGPKVTLGGDSEFEGGMVSDDQGAGQTNRAFYSRNELSVKVDGKSDAGLGYGAEIWLQADTSADTNGRGVNANRTFIYLDGGWGRVEGGSNYGADQTMKVDASTIARATGGIAGDWRFFANNKNGNPFIATPDLPINYDITGTGNNGTAGVGGAFGTNSTALGFGDQGTQNLNKLTYYTPKWNGFQAGLSFTPNDNSNGQLTTVVSHPAVSTAGSGATAVTVSQATNIWQGGLSWTGSWDQVGIALSGTGERGDATTASYNDLWAWQLGAKANYMGFSVAGSYEDWGKSLRSDASDASDTKVWTLGGAYEFGPYGVSLTYLTSKLGAAAATNAVGNDKFSNVVVGADYKLAPGLTPYAEVSFFDENAVGTGSLNDNTGQVFLIGTQLNF